MAYYEGKVNGIDAQATSGLEPRCQIFINKDEKNYIQVTTKLQSLQSALELACSKSVKVEVHYDDSSGENILTRVRLLDRDKVQPQHI